MIDKAFKALGGAEWDWTPAGFEAVMKKLGATRKTRDKEMPIFKTPWGAEAQAIIDKTKVRRIEFFFDVTQPKGEFDPDEMEEHAETYAKKLVDYTARAEKVLGKPQKREGTRVSWKLPTARITLGWSNAGSIVPFWISVLVTR